MKNVYFKKISSDTTDDEIRDITSKLMQIIVKEEDIKLETEIPLKVHFGEKGNHTFVKPKEYDGIIDYLEMQGVKTSYIETNVMYGGQRNKKDLHLQTAKDHGFTRVPVIIADGDHGEKYTEVAIDKKHYKTCKLGGEFEKYNQIVVAAHFKGHMLAGFGGAMKQLSMGFASKGGKMAMHLGEKPRLINRKCKKCGVCLSRCNEDALVIGDRSYIVKDKCVGCGACMAACPHKAITIVSLKNIFKMFTGGNTFIEKLAEYAYAAHKDRKNIYINYITNITAGCDCEPRKMKILMDDIGILISTDPVAIDKASYDMVAEKGKKFRGHKIFEYAEKIGMGTENYNLREI